MRLELHFNDDSDFFVSKLSLEIYFAKAGKEFKYFIIIISAQTVDINSVYDSRKSSKEMMCQLSEKYLQFQRKMSSAWSKCVEYF